MKKYVSLALLIALITLTSYASASQPNFELLINALESDDLNNFTKLLENGLDPDFVGEDSRPSHWVNCLAAKKETDLWLKAIKNNGGDLNSIRQPYLEHLLNSGFANALVCSVVNSSSEPFRFLVKNGADIEVTICPLCKQEFGKSTLIEFTVSFRQFNKSAWLLENYPEVKRQINDRVIDHLELQTALREDRAEGFWKTIDLIRANGHTVNPKVKR